MNNKKGNIALIAGFIIAGIVIVTLFTTGAVSNIFKAFSVFGSWGLVLGFLFILIIILGIINVVTKNRRR